jgi:hypothetical protein
MTQTYCDEASNLQILSSCFHHIAIDKLVTVLYIRIVILLLLIVKVGGLRSFVSHIISNQTNVHKRTNDPHATSLKKIQCHQF